MKKSIKSKIATFKNILLDIAFPRFCIECKKEGSYLCKECLLFLSEASYVCPVCIKPQFYGKRHQRCLGQGPLTGGVSLWDYEGVVKKLIDKFKNKGVVCIAEELVFCGFYFVEENKKRMEKFLLFLFDPRTVISYIPTSKKDKKKRGFDHGEEIAKSLGKITGKKVSSLLEKKKEVIALENSLLFKKEKAPWGVVLVDDFWISGETVKEAAKVLKRNKVKKVWVFTLARVA